ncbi:hypothetical protein Patl1_00125 [Pistacia atlantica]|uniref:Uncharacterized protein n=1 Tax=Pistacia atlantica TaxID=434234 RepID=A0ACC1C846_9ROSI|nr:hypothetical protein Patl1_00125 [Pistacia atlantica]
MADPQHLYGKTRLPANLTRQPVGVGQAKSFTHLFSKFLFFALFLVAIPFFPSQAPEFINQTILTKFWDLFQLLFIGLAVSYGLFCRRNVDMDFETHSSNDDPESYVSSVLHVSSIFGDDSDNSYGYGDKNVYQTGYSDNYKEEFAVNSEQTKTGSLNRENNVSQAWNSQYYRGESMVVIDQPNYVLNEYGESGLIIGHKPLGLPIRSLRSSNQGSPEISNGSESSSISTDSSNSPSNHVVINENFGHLGPLNLENKFNETAGLSSSIPWRSRSGTMETRGDADISTHASHFRPLSVDETQFESLKSQSFWSSDCYSSQPCSVSNSPNRLSSSGTLSSELENLKMDIRNSYPPTSMPTNGKTSLNALRIRRYTDGSLFGKNARKNSKDNLKDRSGGKREYPLGLKDDLKDRSGSKREDSLRLKDDLKDRSGSKREDLLRLKDDLKNRSGSKREDSLRLKDDLKDRSGSKREDLLRLKDDLKDRSESKRDDSLGLKDDLKDRSESKREDALGLKDDLKDSSGSKREYLLGRNQWRSSSLKLDENPTNPVKASSRGKSVRTIRTRRYTEETMSVGERDGKHIKGEIGKAANDEIEGVLRGKNEMKSEGFGNQSTGARKQDLDNHYPMQKPTFSEFQKRKDKESSEDFTVVSKEESESEVENFQLNSYQEAVDKCATDAESDSNEVDKKAGEFIARFREQIRLQKMASIDRSKGRNYFR